MSNRNDLLARRNAKILELKNKGLTREQISLRTALRPESVDRIIRSERERRPR